MKFGFHSTLDNGRAAITGETTSTNFPISTDAHQSTYGGGIRDAYITILDPDGRAIDFSTYLGGSLSDRGLGIFAEGGIIVASGNTNSSNFPLTSGAYDQTFAGTTEGYIVKFGPESATVVQPVIAEQSVVSSSSAGDECTDCIGCSVNNTQGSAGGPINTRTGGYDYTTTDLSFVTTAGELSFVRTYSSLALNLSTNLSPGWTHNQDIRLIFPDDTGGQDDVVLLKSRSANQYSFLINPDNTYSASPGIRAKLTRNSGSSITYTVVDMAQNIYTFDEDGKLLTFANPQGRSWSYTYNSNGYLDQISANNGASELAFNYDSQGRLISVNDHTGREVSYEYDSAGDLVTVTDVLNQDWTFTYDNTHRITHVIAPDLSIVERTEYDPQGRAIRQFEGEGNLVVELIYHADGTTTVVDALDNERNDTYDSRGTLVSETNEVDAETTTVYGNNFQPLWVTNAAGHTLSMTWSADGVNLLTKTDPAGNMTQNTYDALNNLTSTTDPKGNTTTYTYSGKLLLTRLDELNGLTTYTYTPEGYLESVEDVAGRTTFYTYNAIGQRESMTDPNGNTWNYTYDALGRLTDTTDPSNRVAHTEYNAAGQIVLSVQNYSLVHAQNDQSVYNITTKYEYNARGNQISVTDTFNRPTQYVYDNADRLIQTVDADGGTTTNEYDVAGRLISTSDALGHETTYSYDATGRLLSTTNALGISSGTTTFDIATNTSTVTNIAGAATTFYYDELGRVFKVMDALGNSTLTTYDVNGNVETRTDQMGRVTNYEYDELNRLIKTIDANGGTTRTVYNEKGQRIASIDARGKETTYTYDTQGRLIVTTAPLLRTTTTEYDQYGRRFASIDADGKRTEYTYDLLDRVIAVEDALGHSSSTTYNALGNVLVRTDVNGHDTTYTYDNLYRTKTITDPNGNTTTNTYDLAGNLLSVENELGETTSYTYDVLNRRTAVSDMLGNSTETYFNSLGQISSVIDANDVVTHFEYDAVGRQTAVVLNYQPTVQTDAQTNVRYEYTYNAVGNRETVKDANENVTHYTYDVLNRVIGKSDPLTNAWSYEYDAAGNQIMMTDAKEQVTHFTYDDAGQLTAIDYPDSDVSFTYTITGQRETMVDGLGTTTWTYDDLNRVISVTDPFNQTIGYGYDAVGNRTTLTYPDAHLVTYSFDPANRLIEVTDPEVSVGYAYDDANRLNEITRSNDVDSIYSYNAAGRLTGLTHSASQGLLASYAYTYDPAGNMIQAIEDVSRPVPPTPTPTTIPTDTITPTDLPTESPTETLPPSSTPVDTLTPSATNTESPVPTETESTLTPAVTDTGIPTETFTPTVTPVASSTNIYLHGTGSNSNPATLFLNTTAPSGTTAKYKDSDNIKFNNGNPWKEVGTWAAAPVGLTGQLSSLNDLHVWLGLQNNGNQNKNFDLRAEVYKNGQLITSGESLCITDITGGAENAKEATLSFAAFSSTTLNGTDNLSIKILARAGTDGAGNHCGGSNTAVGLRLYFDSTTRPSKFGTLTSVAGKFPSLAMEQNFGLSLVSFAMPKEMQIVSDAPQNAPQSVLYQGTNLQSSSLLTINYTYDPLRRLNHAEYSDGRDFRYIYDSNGNTLEATQDLGSAPVTTTYTYDIANQLVTAQADSTVWHYAYDANGSLVEALPDGNESSGAKRYTYNAAGYLIMVDSHDGSIWNLQTEMTYNGLGTRMTSSALGVTTQYASDGQAPLTISSGSNFTTILYGRGPVAEKMNEWNFVQSDGLNLPRQLTNMNSEITMSVRYNPWGKPIETEGIGNFDASFIGTLIDATTGLIYIGNGQYYDPETGRFLTRGVNPNGTNPYIPWNPISGIIGPLVLGSVFSSRRKGKMTYRDKIILLAFVFLVLANLACCDINDTPTTEPTAVDTAETAVATAGPGNEGDSTTAQASETTQSPVDEAESGNCIGCTPAGKYYVSAYYIVGEDQYSDDGGIVPVPASGNAKTTIINAPSNSYWYLSKDGPSSGYTFGGSGDELKARYKFLYHGINQNDTGGMCVQGTGKLLDERGGFYIFCPQSLKGIDPDTKMEEAGIGFEWQTTDILNKVIGHEFDTIAICAQDPLLSASTQTKIVIPDLANYMVGRGDGDTTFTVRDTGEGLCTKDTVDPNGFKNMHDTIDLFVGAGKVALDNHATPLIQKFPKPSSVEVFIAQ